MSGYTLSGYERETIINFNAGDDTAEMYTADPVWIRKMNKLMEQNPEQFKLGRVETYHREVIAKKYKFPKRFITIRSKDKVSTMTEEQRKEAAERMSQLKKNR